MEHDDEAERRRRRYRINTRTFPLLRFGGFALLALLAGLQSLLYSEVEVQLQPILTGLLVYSSLAALLMKVAYSEKGWGRNLSLIFFALDVPVYVWVIYFAGGPDSLLLPVLLVRVADQVPFSRSRVLFFTHLGCLSYAAMLLFWESSQVNWGAESCKILVLYICGNFISSAAGTNKRLRMRLVEAMHLSKSQANELYQSNQELREARQVAEVAKQAQARLLHSASHELRTPLNAILGFCQMLIQDTRPEKRERYLNNIEKSGERLLELIDRLLLLTGDSDSEHQELDLQSLIEPLIKSLEDPETKTRFDLSSSGNLWVSADLHKLRRLLQYMFEDAAAIAGSAGRCEVCCQKQNDKLLLTLRSHWSGGTATPGRDWTIHFAVQRTLAESQGFHLVLTQETNHLRELVLTLPAQL